MRSSIFSVIHLILDCFKSFFKVLNGMCRQSAGDQHENASSMAAAIEELTFSIAHMSDLANDANTLSQSSCELTQSARDVVGKTVSMINDISKVIGSTAQLVELLGSKAENAGQAALVIREIAEQTNLLALNAAIEAARAGALLLWRMRLESWLNAHAQSY